MKKVYIMLAIIMASITQAEYKINYNLEKNSIVFKSKEAAIEWIDTTPLYSEWIDKGDLYNCSKWIPATTTELSGKTITQKAICSQKQERTRQERQKDKNSELTQNIGEAIVESNIITMNSSRSIAATGYIQVGRGTKTCVEFSTTYGGGYWLFDKRTGEASGLYYGKTFQDKAYSVPKTEILSVIVDGYIISRGVLFDDQTNNDKYGICKQPV